jgi:hypothetical protein
MVRSIDGRTAQKEEKAARQCRGQLIKDALKPILRKQKCLIDKIIDKMIFIQSDSFCALTEAT